MFYIYVAVGLPIWFVATPDCRSSTSSGVSKFGGRADRGGGVFVGPALNVSGNAGPGEASMMVKVTLSPINRRLHGCDAFCI